MKPFPKKETPFDVNNYIDNVHNYGLDIYKREIYLNGAQGDSFDSDPGVDYRSSITLIKNLQILENLGRSKIKIIMNLEGGDWPSCMAIYDKIKQSKCFVEILCFAHATSSSGVILQAARKRIINPNAYFMIHYGSIGVDSNSQAVSETVKYNDKECHRMLNIFAEKAVNGPFFKSKRWGIKKVAEYLDNQIRLKSDWYLDAQESVDYGFADTILE